MSDDTENVGDVEETETEDVDADESESDTGSAPDGIKPSVYVAEDPSLNLRLIRQELSKENYDKAEPGAIGNEVFRNGRLVRLAQTDDGELTLVPFVNATMNELLKHRISFVKINRHGDPYTVEPTATFVMNVLEAPDALDVPVVQQIVNAPVFGPGGELHTESGLLREAKVWYEPADGMKLTWEVPDEPTEEQLAIARYFMTELLSEFPFASEADRATAWALYLLLFVRPMIDGPTPLHSIEAPTEGTGKDILAQTLLIPARGFHVESQTEPEDDAEWRKRLTAFLLSGRSVFYVNNVDPSRRFGSSVLAAALTESGMVDRVLGVSKMTATMRIRNAWVSTGNNPSYTSEIARRSVPSRLDANRERPSDRTFKYALPDTAYAWRGQLIWAALTLIRGWLARGRPGPAEGVPVIGSYSTWREVMGGILTVAGNGSIADYDPDTGAWSYDTGRVAAFGDAFLGNYEASMRKHSEHQSDGVCTALEKWWNAFGGQPVSATELLGPRAAVAFPGSSEPPTNVGTLLIEEDTTGLARQAVSVKLGWKLKRLDGRVSCGFKVERVDDGPKARQARYRLREIDS